MSAAAAARLVGKRPYRDDDRENWPAWTRTRLSISKDSKLEDSPFLYPSLQFKLTYLAYSVLLRILVKSRQSGYVWVNTNQPELARELGKRSEDGVQEAVLELQREMLLKIKRGGPRGVILYRLLEANLPTEEFPEIPITKKPVASEAELQAGEDEQRDGEEQAGLAPTRSARFYPRTVNFKNGSGVRKVKYARYVEDHEIEIVNGPSVPIAARVEFDEESNRSRTIFDLEPITALLKKGEDKGKYNRSTAAGNQPNIQRFFDTATRCGVRGSDVQTDRALDLLASYPIEDQIAAEAGIRERFEAGQYPRFAPAILKYVTERAWTDIVRPAKRQNSNGHAKSYETSAERRKRIRQKERNDLLDWAESVDKARGVS